MYVKLNNDEEFIPAIMPEGGKFGTIEIIEQPLVLKGIKFYDSIKKIINEDEIIFQYGENITFNINTKKLNFKFQGTISEVINDMSFVLMLINITENDCKNLGSFIEDKINIIKEFQKNLKKINIILNDKFRPFRDIDYSNMKHFNNLINNDKDTIKNINVSSLYSIKLCGKNIVLLLNRDKEGIKVYNFFDNISKKLTITVKRKRQYIRICPYSLLIEKINFEDILNYNKKSVSLSIEDCENNDINNQYMNLLVLMLINSYDKTGNE